VLLSFAAIVLGQPLNARITMALVALSFVLAIFTYLVFERPIRRSFNNQRTTAILVGLMICVGALGLYTYKHHGLLAQTDKAILINDTGIYPCKNQFDAKQLCVFGNLKSSEVIFIYGDSHAEHLTAALAEAFGSRYKLVFAYTSSCYFGEHPDSKYKRPEACEPIVALTRELKTKEEKIVATILSQRWHGYGITTSDQIIAAMADAMKAFNLNPNKIIIVGSTANVDLRCAKYNYYFASSRPLRLCEQEQSSVNINQEFITTTSKILAPEKVVFVYPYLMLCPNDRCTPIREGTLLYGDTHHLTRAGAELLMPAIQTLIDESDNVISNNTSLK
jgi:hypothetical protein